MQQQSTRPGAVSRGRWGAPPAHVWPRACKSQVLNIEPNLKVAVEVQDPADFALYALNQVMAYEWVGTGPEDYMCSVVTVLDAAKKLHDNMDPVAIMAGM